MNQMTTLKSQWEALKTENGKLRIRDAAKKLEVTEAELIATTVGDTAIRLKPEFKDILTAVESLGKVMALTRNDFCVHERKGIYHGATFSGPMGLFVNPDIDLRIFLSQWASAFAVSENGRKSLQFFGKDGDAVHKIYITPDSHEEAYEALIAKYTAEDQGELLIIQPRKTPAIEKADAEADQSGFRERWLALKDTHEFHGLLREFGLSRTQGLRLAPVGYANQITVDSVKTILEQAAATDLEIMVFTGSTGCIQIHTGPVKNILVTGPWLNVLDPDFNLHLRADAIDKVWLVRKPTEDGVVTSIEVFDAQGEIIVQFFGKRKPGIPENEKWRLLSTENAKLITV